MPVGAAIALHAHRSHIGEQHHRELPHLAVQTRGAELLPGYGIGGAQNRQAVGIDDPRWLTGEDVGAHVANLVAGTGPLVGTTVQYLLDRAQGPVREDEARR